MLVYQSGNYPLLLPSVTGSTFHNKASVFCLNGCDHIVPSARGITPVNHSNLIFKDLQPAKDVILSRERSAGSPCNACNLQEVWRSPCVPKTMKPRGCDWAAAERASVPTRDLQNWFGRYQWILAKNASRLVETSSFGQKSNDDQQSGADSDSQLWPYEGNSLEAEHRGLRWVDIDRLAVHTAEEKQCSAPLVAIVPGNSSYASMTARHYFCPRCYLTLRGRD